MRSYFGSVLGLRLTGTVLLFLVLILGIIRVPSVLAQNSLLMNHTWGMASGPTGASAIAVDNSGDIYVAGYMQGMTNSSAVLLKYNSTGSLLWTDSWGGPSGQTEANGLVLGPSGAIYLTGYTSGFGSQGALLLLKFFVNGSFGWARSWSGAPYDSGAGVALDSLGNIYITGTADNYGGGPGHVAVLKFSPSDALLWARTWGGANGNYGTGVAVDSTGIYVGGSENCYFSSATCNAFIMKLNSTGGLVFQKSWGGSQNNYGSGLAFNSTTGSLYLVGQLNVSGGGTFILKFDTLGRLQWQRTWGGSRGEQGFGITTDSQGRIYAVGTSYSYGPGNGTAFIVQLDSTGNLMNESTWGAQNNNRPGTRAFGVATDSMGYAYVAGTVNAPPPYSLGNGNSTLGMPNLPMNNLSYTLVQASQVVGAPSGIIHHPSGTQTFVVGGDAFFFKIGLGIADINTISFSPLMLVFAASIAILVRRRKASLRASLLAA